MLTEDTKEVLNRSLRLNYDDHVSRLLSIPEPYLREVRPNKPLAFLDILKKYNADIATELDRYGEELNAEVLQIIEKIELRLSENDKGAILSLINFFLKPNLYTNRFDIFVESVDRTLSGYGIRFEKQNYRIDIPRALCEVGSKNKCRKIVSRISNEIDIFVLRTGEENNKKLPNDLTWYSKVNHLYHRNPVIFWIIGFVISAVIGLVVL